MILNIGIRKTIDVISIVCILLLMRCIDKPATIQNHADSSESETLKGYPYFDLPLAKQFPYTNCPIHVREAALRHARTLGENGNRTEGQWETQGPGNIGARVNTIAVSSVDINLIAIGYPTGGVYLTEDGGTNWRPIFDKQLFLSISDISFHPTDRNTLLVATGDRNIGGYFNVGDGLWRSEDLGATWESLGLKDTRILSSVKYAPNNSNTIYATSLGPPYNRGSAERGVFKSMDNGGSWEQILSLGDSTGVTELHFHPYRPQVLFASAWTRLRSNKNSSISGPRGGIYRSKDGGINWEKLKGGLPEGAVSRAGIVIDPNNANQMYSIFVDPSNLQALDVYRSIDGGDSWTALNLPATEAAGVYAGFGWYFCDLVIDPTDFSKFYLLGVDLYQCQYIDTLAVELAAPSWGSYEVHADKHDMVFVGEKVYLATDGGMYRANSNDLLNSWEKIEENVTTEFYRVGYNPHLPQYFVGGAQDNGTTGGNNNFISSWDRIRGGDGFQPAFYKSDPNVWFAETQRGGLSYSTNAGQSFSGATTGLEGSRHWDMQYIISPHTDSILFTATDKVYKSKGLPPLWEAISDSIVDLSKQAFIHQATSIDQSPINENIIVVGTSDGLAWITRDGGANWEKMSNGLPDRYVSSIKTSPYEENVIFITYSGYRDGDYVPLIYKSADQGYSFSPIHSNLPELAISDVFILPFGNDNNLLVGTDGGVYLTTNGGSSWDRLGDNMPYIATFDLEYDPTTNSVISATQGGGITSFDLDQIGLSPLNTFNPIELSIDIFPNPTNTNIHISSKNHSNINSLVIYNASGQEIYKLTQKGSPYILIEIADWQQGIYYVKCNGVLEKFVVFR